MANAVKNYVCELTVDQAASLRALLVAKGWQLDSIPYAHWRGRRGGYDGGCLSVRKLTVQGGDTVDLCSFFSSKIFRGPFRLREELVK